MFTAQVPGTRYTPGSKPAEEQVPPPPGADTPWDQVHPPGPGTPPGSRHRPGTRYTPQADTPPPPTAEHAGRHGQCTAGPHPAGMQSCYTGVCQSVHVVG